MEAGIKTWMRSKLMLEQDFDQNVTQVFWILPRSRWVMLRRLVSRCHKKFQMTHFFFAPLCRGHRLKIPTESERGHGNMSVDVLETGLPQYLVQATLSIYLDKIFLHSSTFGQSCFLPSSLFQDFKVFIHSFHANRPNNSQCKYHATGRKLLRRTEVLIWNKQEQGKFVLVC